MGCKNHLQQQLKDLTTWIRRGCATKLIGAVLSNKYEYYTTVFHPCVDEIKKEKNEANVWGLQSIIRAQAGREQDASY